MKIKDFFDNKDELITGAVYGLTPVLFIGWWTLVTILLCSVFWRLGGVTGGNKWFRRLGVSWTISVALFLATYDLWCLVPFCLMWGPLSLGYGLPDPPDEGSKLGAFFFRLTKSNEFLANLLTRGTIGLLCALTLLPFFISTLVAGAF